jgi:hypothetical protein
MQYSASRDELQLMWTTYASLLHTTPYAAVSPQGREVGRKETGHIPTPPKARGSKVTVLKEAKGHGISWKT